MVGGNTELFFGDGAVVNGWTYGGGAGRDAAIPTEVAGSTNITIDGGRFVNNKGHMRAACRGPPRIPAINPPDGVGRILGIWLKG